MPRVKAKKPRKNAAQPRTQKQIEEHRKAELIRQRGLRAEGRDVVIPPVVDPRRRGRCRLNLFLFARTYFGHWLKLKSSPTHKEIYDRFQVALLFGGKEAIAAPRAMGKDTILKIGVIWALLYGHRHFLAFGGPNLKFATQRINSIKRQILKNDLLMEDFPEVCAPVRALDGAVLRAKTQTVAGELTELNWSTGEVQFPRVPGSVSSGAVLVPFGIEGADRGLEIDGARPDIFVLSDIENEESADSDTQKVKNESRIDQGLMGLGGPGEELAGFMLCTIFCKGSLAEKYTDPRQKPVWNGHRYKALVKEPAHPELWDTYLAMRREGMASQEDMLGRWADAFYVVHRKEMDEGAEVIWADRYIKSKKQDGKPAEISALQSIYNERCDKGEAYFLSEMQNDPPEKDVLLKGELTARLVSERTSGYAPGIVPANARWLVQGMDIGQREIHFCVMAVLLDGGSFIVDYGRYAVEQLSDGSDSTGAAKGALEKRVLETLRLRRAEMEEHGYMDSEGGRRDVDLSCVDTGFFTDMVYSFIKESGPKWRAIKGDGTTKGIGISKYTAPKATEQNSKTIGYHWYCTPQQKKGLWLYRLDVDHFKEYTHLRFLQAPDSEGSCLLWGSEPKAHLVYGRHIVAEAYDIEARRWVQLKPQNHWLDSTAYAHAAAAMLGVWIRANVTSVMTTHVKSPSNRAQGVKRGPGGRVDRKPVQPNNPSGRYVRRGGRRESGF